MFIRVSRTNKLGIGLIGCGVLGLRVALKRPLGDVLLRALAASIRARLVREVAEAVSAEVALARESAVALAAVEGLSFLLLRLALDHWWVEGHWSLCGHRRWGNFIDDLLREVSNEALKVWRSVDISGLLRRHFWRELINRAAAQQKHTVKTKWYFRELPRKQTFDN